MNPSNPWLKKKTIASLETKSTKRKRLDLTKSIYNPSFYIIHFKFYIEPQIVSFTFSLCLHYSSFIIHFTFRCSLSTYHPVTSCHPSMGWEFLVFLFTLKFLSLPYLCVLYVSLFYILIQNLKFKIINFSNLRSG